MLGEKYEIELKISDYETYKLEYNFRFLKNLFILLDQNPFEYLNNFLEEKDEDKKKQYYINIIYCMLNGKIEITKLIDIVNNLDDTLLYSLLSMIVIEMNEENIFEKEENTAEDKGNKENDTTQEFLKMWDFNYYVATVQLKMTKEEFLNSSPREIRTLTHLHRDFLKNIILERDIDLEKARNKAKEEFNNTHDNKGNKIQHVNRLSDLF